MHFLIVSQWANDTFFCHNLDLACFLLIRFLEFQLCIYNQAKLLFFCKYYFSLYLWLQQPYLNKLFYLNYCLVHEEKHNLYSSTQVLLLVFCQIPEESNQLELYILSFLSFDYSSTVTVQNILQVNDSHRFHLVASFHDISPKLLICLQL